MAKQHYWFGVAIALLASGCQGADWAAKPKELAPTATESTTTAKCAVTKPNIMVVAGGGNPGMNEISLEKNVLFFQRTLRVLGINPAIATILFANGNNGQATVRYIDNQGQQRFKKPQIPNLKGASTLQNVQTSLQRLAAQKSTQPSFVYFTGHGYHQDNDYENNFFVLWGERELTVQRYTALLDQLPTQPPVVTVMAQCFSGGFANLIYTGGKPQNAVAPHNRCGFFATVKTRPSVGCTPEVNEADYVDYSSSFFSGLSGRKRTGATIPQPDYNRDGRVSYAEAHAFAKIDSRTLDIPVSTSEIWLERQVSTQQRQLILRQPIASLLQSAAPERSQVVQKLAQQFRFDLGRSFEQNIQRNPRLAASEELEALRERLSRELITIGAEQALRTAKNSGKTAVLDRLQKCEAGSLGDR